MKFIAVVFGVCAIVVAVYAGVESSEVNTELSLMPPGDESETLAMECALCHFEFYLDFQESTHSSKQVFCSSCHGEAKRHREVENNDVKPDVHFRTEKREQTIERLCTVCHGDTVMSFKQGQHQEAPAPEEGDAADCTVCHDPHK